MNAKTLLILPLVALAACGGNKAGGGEADAISQEVKEFTSPDLELYELHSKVAVLVNKIYAAEKENDEVVKKDLAQVDTIYFDEAGQLVREVTYSTYTNSVTAENVYTNSADGKTSGVCTQFYKEGGKVQLNITVARNSDGAIEKRNFKQPGQYDSDLDNRNEYEWKAGKVVAYNYTGWEWGSTTKYGYDERGLRASESATSFDEGEMTDVAVAYSYTALDECDNWTERVVTTDMTTSYDGMEDQEKEKTTYFMIGEREITYYN